MSSDKLEFFDVFEDITGGNHKFQTNDYLREGCLAVVDQGKKLIAGYVNDLNKQVKTNSPVIVFGDHTRILKYVDFPFALGADGVKVLKPKIKADTKFLFYQLQRIYIPETGYNRHFKYLKESKLLLPPLPIQQKIASILDQADVLRKKDQQLLAKYDELLQVVFYDMFGDPVRNEKGWEVKKLGSLTKRIVVGHVGPTSHGYVEKGIPFLRTQNVRENFINYEDMNYISEDFHKKLSKSKINFGDILISRVGVNRGMAAIVPKDLNQANCANVVIVGKSELFNSLFISFVLNNTFGRGAAFGYSVGSAQGVVNTQIVKVWPIIYPTVELQNQFSTIAQNIQQQKKQVKQQLQQSEALFQSLLQRAFKGDLVKE